jgi:hypothetical protein
VREIIAETEIESRQLKLALAESRVLDNVENAIEKKQVFKTTCRFDADPRHAPDHNAYHLSRILAKPLFSISSSTVSPSFKGFFRLCVTK